jgi:hypothetical protein
MEKQIIKPTDVVNYKPSDFIEKAIDDLDAVAAAGYGFNMGRWMFIAGTKNASAKCTVCLGGAVLMNRFVNEPVTKRAWWDQTLYLNSIISGAGIEIENTYESNILSNIAYLFDAIRRGDVYDIIYHIKAIWGIPADSYEPLYDIVDNSWGRESFLGTTDSEDIPALKKQISGLVFILREQGF